MTFTTVYEKLLKLVDKCQRYSKPKQCRLRDKYSMIEKIQFPGFMFTHVMQRH